MTPMIKSITLQTLAGGYAISRLPPESAIPPWADGAGFVSISRSSEELSMVCLQSRVPGDVRVDTGWTAMRFVGPFAFGETGVVLSVVRPLSEGGLGVFVVSTFDGDHLLLKTADMPRAMALLAQAGHQLLPA
jgi:hypothetical protein